MFTWIGILIFLVYWSLKFSILNFARLASCKNARPRPILGNTNAAGGKHRHTLRIFYNHLRDELDDFETSRYSRNPSICQCQRPDRTLNKYGLHCNRADLFSVWIYVCLCIFIYIFFYFFLFIFFIYLIYFIYIYSADDVRVSAAAIRYDVTLYRVHIRPHRPRARMKWNVIKHHLH